jgi:hypothetical protein
MTQNDAGPGGTTVVPQGDLRLLESDLARRLLASTLPARFAFVWTDGTPRCCRPAGVIDFETRLPSSLGGVTGRGQDG